jgi:Carbohydrate-selective porin, OprB family
MSDIRFKILTYLLSAAKASPLFLAMALLQAVSAQANPLSRVVPPQDRAVGQSPMLLAEQAARSLGSPLPPSQVLESDAVAVRRPIDPPFVVPRSYNNEAELIQTLANQPTSVGTGMMAPPPQGPVFALPSASSPVPVRAPVVVQPAANVVQPAANRPLLVTATTNSDFGLHLRSVAPVPPVTNRASSGAMGGTAGFGAAGGIGARSNPQFRLPPIVTTAPVKVVAPTPSRATITPYGLRAMTSPSGFAQSSLSQSTQVVVPGSTLRSINPSAMQTANAPGLSPLDAPLALPTQKDALLTQSGSSNAGALTAPNGGRPLLRSTAMTSPKFTLQGVYLYQGDQTSARARLSIVYPLTPRVLFGTNLDLATGNAFTDTREEGFSVNELYIATSLADIPNLRFVVGQIDLTSYFDRNSFAKDGATHFFNAAFQTNPALSAAGLSSRPGLLFNWALTDNIEAKAAAFSSSRGLSDFALDGFAGELGIRYGNAIIRGTYVTDRESGSRDAFNEVFQISRGNNEFGVLKGDREESYGINAEVFIPNLKMGIFGRYGRYSNRDLDRGGDTYSGGITFLDLFAPDDRLGIAYGRGLSNDNLRRGSGERTPDVLEAFYDFRFLPNLRVGFSIQERNDFSEVIAGIRVKTEFDVTPRGRLVR